MNSLSTTVNNLEWRRSKVSELASQGYSQPEIARILKISQSTINRDISYLRQQSKENIKRYIDERLPEEYEKCLVGLTAILREMWSASEKAQDTKEKVLALSLAKEVYSMKLDLLSNVSTVETAMKFISDYKENKNNNNNKSKDLLQNSLVPNTQNETKEFSSNDIEEEEETTTTTNKVF